MPTFLILHKSARTGDYTICSPDCSLLHILDGEDAIASHNDTEATQGGRAV